MWPQNSPDLNLVDYAIWSVIQLDAACNIQRVHYYLSHCYTIAWDRLSNQFFFVCVCVYVCMYVCMYVCVCVSVGTLTVAFFNRASRNLVRTFGA